MKNGIEVGPRKGAPLIELWLRASPVWNPSCTNPLPRLPNSGSVEEDDEEVEAQRRVGNAFWKIFRKTSL